MVTGRAAVLSAPGVPMEIRAYPVLDPSPEQMVARITMASICGSDLHMWRGEMPNLGSGAIVPGHEMTGVAYKLGRAWQTDSLGRPLREGDRVTFSFFNPCGKCWACLSNTARCPNRYALRAPADEAPHFHGAYAEYHVVKPGQW